MEHLSMKRFFNLKFFAYVGLCGLLIAGGILAKRKFWDLPKYPLAYKTSLANDHLCEKCEMKIPKIIHRIWTQWGPVKKGLSPLYQQFDVDLKKLHPDWQVMEWDDAKIEEFIKTHHPDFWGTYNHFDTPIKKHDAIRYLVVDHYGGVFIQHSMKFMKNMDPLMRGHEAVFFEQSAEGYLLTNGFFAARPHHSVFAQIKEKLKRRNKFNAQQATGPYFITGVIRSYIKKQDASGVKIFSHKQAFPFDWNQKTKEPFYSQCILNPNKCHLLFPAAYAFTLWKGEWKNQE